MRSLRWFLTSAVAVLCLALVANANNPVSSSGGRLVSVSPSSPARSFVSAVTWTTISNNQVRYIECGTQTANTNPNPIFLVPADGTVSLLSVYINSGSNSGTVTIDLMIWDKATWSASTLTVGKTGTGNLYGTDTTHSVAVLEGYMISARITAPATYTGQVHMITFAYKPTVGG